MKKKYKHLTLKDRYIIEHMLEKTCSLREISKSLGRSPNTISIEIKKNSVNGKYSAKKADHKAYCKRYWSKKDCLDVLKNRELEKFIIDGVERFISPETLSKRTKKDPDLPNTSGKAIRKFIKKRTNLERLFYRNRVHKKSGPKSKKQKEKLQNRKFIDQRNEDFPNLKEEYGHWEGDFIVSKKSKTVLLVLVEKLSRYALLKKLPNRKNALVNQAIFKLINNLEIKSLTLDNDIAFQKHEKLEKKLKSPVYFCDSYCSWQKGLVENMNWQIRQFVPKKTNLKLITNKDFSAIQKWLNENPRQCLDGYSSDEKMLQYELKLDHPIFIKKKIQNKKPEDWFKIKYSKEMKLLVNLINNNIKSLHV
jgi:transposase, IS30 family